MDKRNLSFTKSDRILKRKQYLDIYARGKRFRNRLFYIYFLENGLEHSRLGLTVSRKVGGSVVQNLIKRRFREIFRCSRIQTNPPLDILVNATRNTARVDFRSLEEEFHRELKNWGHK